jgi:hypothetical protein
MSTYLARLKQLENKNISQYPPDSEPSKPSKAPFEPFEGMHPVRIEKKIVDAPAISALRCDTARDATGAPIPDPAMEARRQRVLAMLGDNPTITYAAVTDIASDPDAVIVALAIRGRASCELLVPRAKWDGMLFIDLLDKHFGTVH